MLHGNDLIAGMRAKCFSVLQCDSRRSALGVQKARICARIEGMIRSELDHRQAVSSGQLKGIDPNLRSQGRKAAILLLSVRTSTFRPETLSVHPQTNVRISTILKEHRTPLPDSSPLHLCVLTTVSSAIDRSPQQRHGAERCKRYSHIPAPEGLGSRHPLETPLTCLSFHPVLHLSPIGM